jgi:hypothetical protein
MSFTSDDTFGDKIRPFSEDFNAAMRGVAADLSNLNTYLPILNELILRESPAGAQRSVDTFPALIVGEAQVGGGRYIYDIREVSLLTSEDVNTPAALGGRQGSAFNVAEYTGAVGFNGTGIPEPCVAQLTQSGSKIEVLTMVGQVVMASGYNPVTLPSEPEEDTGEDSNGPVVPDFVFHAWVPYCISCGSLDGVIINDEERRSTGVVDPYNVSFPPETTDFSADNEPRQLPESGSGY